MPAAPTAIFRARSTSISFATWCANWCACCRKTQREIAGGQGDGRLWLRHAHAHRAHQRQSARARRLSARDRFLAAKASDGAGRPAMPTPCARLERRPWEVPIDPMVGVAVYDSDGRRHRLVWKRREWTGARRNKSGPPTRLSRVKRIGTIAVTVVRQRRQEILLQPATRQKTSRPIGPRRQTSPRAGPRAKSRREGHGKSTRKTAHYWSGRVTRESDALDLDKGVFSLDDPKRIAASLKRSAPKAGGARRSPTVRRSRCWSSISTAPAKICPRAGGGRWSRPRPSCAGYSVGTDIFPVRGLEFPSRPIFLARYAA